MQELISEFTKRETKIRDWLADAETRWRDRKAVLHYLIFSLCTPQSKAKSCHIAVTMLLGKGLLKTNSSPIAISKQLKGVRFPNNKARYIVEANKNFSMIYDKIQALHAQPLELREWLVKNVKGYGYKEASHFLRNIGLGEELAILDVHILRELEKIGLLEKGVKLSPRRYLEIEKKFIELSRNLKLKPAELDIAIWLARSGNAEIM